MNACINIKITENDLKRGVEISVPGFKGDVGGVETSQVFLELQDGRLRIHVWNGEEDPAGSFTIERDPGNQQQVEEG